ncbi:DUF6325 family protein [Rhodococcus sp. IEGM 1351]|uniref:DUF6325 family protein n=1 Tax=Rhodococcus sp. IEGM 1351 TaxID=3047089 RepID=UPI0024B7B3FA|nr:DUF6325 family protein [Rhodococcus sp. IEGM 1351]MDI9941191.1 DUF6325 family protein [Rhodococcus sp. IEGM 1351]
MNDTDFDELGPIDYLVVEFPADRRPDGSALPLLIDLVDRNIIRVLDLVFVRKEADGSLAGIAVEDLGFEGGVDVTVFAEATTGLIDRTDLEDAAAVLAPGCSGAILVYKNTWAAPFASALRREGAQLVASGRIPVQGILAALDTLDATS